LPSDIERTKLVLEERKFIQNFGVEISGKRMLQQSM
jgi:hypothetical protein